MALSLPELPRFLILEPGKGVRLHLELEEAACEIDVELDNPKPGRSFVALVGHPGGPIVQRARLAGAARLYFAPEKAGEYVLYLTNPMDEAAVIRLAARDVPSGKPLRHRGARPRRARAGRAGRRVRPLESQSAGPAARARVRGRVRRAPQRTAGSAGRRSRR